MTVNFVLLLAGALLANAEKLLRNGLSLTDVIKGYKISQEHVLNNILPELVLGKVENLLDIDQTARIIKTSLSAKQYGYEDFLSKLIAETCINTISNGASPRTFSVDNVRICKIVGGGVQTSKMVKGMMFKRTIESDIQSVENAVIATFSCPLDNMTTETKGTVLIKNAQELMDFSKGEESMLEQCIASIAATGVNVIVTGGKVADMALHFCNKYNILVLRLMSKWDLRRLCATVNSVCIPKLRPPTKEELGYCQKVYLDSVSEQQVVIFERGTDSSTMCTVLIRGATDNILDDIERAVDDGVNNFKILSKTPDNAEYVAGAGAVEMAIASRLTDFGQKIEGLEQYAVETFANAFETFPKALADNSGLPAQEVISLMYNAHGEGKPATMGVNIESNASSPALLDAAEHGILEPFEIKKWAIKYAVDAVNTVLSVDSVIMAKPAGGPKPRQQKAADWDDED